MLEESGVETPPSRIRGEFRRHNHMIRDIVDDLSSLREQAGFTEESFAHFIGRSVESIYRFEGFSEYPSFDMLRDYAIALGRETDITVS